MKNKWLTCKQCGRTDRSDKVHVGTDERMVCCDCTDGQKLNKYGHGLATLCRNCCPTGHGTR